MVSSCTTCLVFVFQHLPIGPRFSHKSTLTRHFHRGTTVIYLLLYIDDILVRNHDPGALRKFIDRTHREFAIKNFGCLNYFLGLEVSYTPTSLFVGQVNYAHDIFDRAALTDSKPIVTPLVPGE